MKTSAPRVFFVGKFLSTNSTYLNGLRLVRLSVSLE